MVSDEVQVTVSATHVHHAKVSCIGPCSSLTANSECIDSSHAASVTDSLVDR